MRRGPISSAGAGAVACVRARAFTLIELLVVVAILGVLLSVLVPSLGRARLLAKRVTCQGNLSAVGKAGVLYGSDYPERIPVCWRNIPPDRDHPWPSWRAALLPYLAGFEALNCPGVTPSGVGAERFGSAAEVTGQQHYGTANAGSYGVLYQNSLPCYEGINYAGNPVRGHPVWNCSYPVTPGRAWRNPEETVYAADAVLIGGPVTYPSFGGHKGYGTSVILPPGLECYASGELTRRFADRHLGTNCLFVGGYVTCYQTGVLDAMRAGQPDCVWDVE